MPSIEGRATRPRRHDAADPPLAGRRRPRPAGPGPGHRGRACCSSTGWASTPAATSTSASSWPRSGLDVSAYDHRGHGRLRRAARRHRRAGRTLPRRPGRATRGRPRRRRRPAGRAVRPLAGRPHRAPATCLTDRPEPDLVGPDLARRLDSTVPGWKRSMARSSAGVAPGLRIPNDIDGATLSRDPSVAAQDRRRPALRPRAARPVRGRGPARAGTGARRRPAAASALPTLVLHGEDDGLVPVAPRPSRRARPASSGGPIPGLRHELHNEPEGPEIVDDRHRLAAGARVAGRCRLPAQSKTPPGSASSAESVAQPQTRGT